MKNLKRSIFISFFVLIILVILYFFISLLPSRRKNVNFYFNVSAPIKSIEVLKAGEEPFSILRAEDDRFEISGLKGVPLDFNLCGIVFNFMKNVPAEHVFMPKEAQDAYGDVSFSFKVCDLNDNKYVLNIYKKTADGGSYYCKKAGVNELAVVSFKDVEPILNSKLSYVDRKLFSQYNKTFGDDGLCNGDGVKSCVVNRKNLNAPLKFEVDESGSVLYLGSGDFKITEDVKKSVENAPSLLVADSVFCVKPSEEDFKNCGLKEPLASIEYVIDYKNYVINIGNVAKAEQLPSYKENSNELNILKYYYVYVSGLDVIYVVDENSLPWLKF